MVLDLSLPTGLRDLLPDHSAHLADLSARLQEVFSRLGYRRVFLPTLERLEVVERGLSPAALADVLKFVEPGSGEVVAIRPDITPQIARLYAARPDALPSPARLCYDGPVLRAREARAGRPREVYQAGVEMLGAGGSAADAEMLVLLSRALERVGLDDAVVEVGHARFAGAVDRGGAAAREGACRGVGRPRPQGRGRPRRAGRPRPRRAEGPRGPARARDAVRRRRPGARSGHRPGGARAPPPRSARSRRRSGSRAAAGPGRSRSISARRGGSGTTPGSPSPGTRRAPGARSPRAGATTGSSPASAAPARRSGSRWTWSSRRRRWSGRPGGARAAAGARAGPPAADEGRGARSLRRGARRCGVPGAALLMCDPARAANAPSAGAAIARKSRRNPVAG